MFSVGIAQISNSTDLARNFGSVSKLLTQFENAQVDLVLFPECGLSGFSSKMRECTLELLMPYFDFVQQWVGRTGIEVVLPSAVVESGKIFNSGFWFRPGAREQFYKVGLTDSEKGFFSVPDEKPKKVFRVKDFNFAVLICFEMEHSPWTYFNKGEADAILWPGYWGWSVDDKWTATRDEEKSNPIYSNMVEWQIPILQSNFSKNDLNGHTVAGPEGLSFVINSENKLIYKGPHMKSEGFVVSLEKVDGKTLVLDCRSIN